MSISQELKSDIEAYAVHLRSSNQLFQRAEQGRLSRSTVANYISNLHFLVAHTDINLQRARRRAEQLGDSRLASFFAQKAREEAGHDRWAERDLAQLRGSLEVEP